MDTNVSIDPPDFPIAEFPTERIGGVPIAALDRARTARLVVDTALAARRTARPPAIFTSANGQVLSLVARRAGRETADLLSAADMISADGQSLVFASRFFGQGTVRERCATTDLFHDVAELASAEEVSFYILGSSADENAKAVSNVRKLYPNLRLAGSHHGYFATREDEERIIEEIGRLSPDILWICMGFPRELEFSVRWRKSLNSVGVIKTSGGLLNFLSETNSRAPRWMQSAGLEWSYRLALEPRRLFLRYLTTNIHAAWLLVSRTN